MLAQLQLKKSYLLAGLALVLWVLAFRLAFYRTWEAKQVNRQLSARVVQASDVSYQPDYLERKSRNLGKTLALFKVDTVSYRSRVLSVLSEVADRENVRILEVPTQSQDAYYQAPHYAVQRLQFAGDFFALTRFLHKLEDQSGIGSVRSVTYKTINQQVASGKDKSLNMQVYLEASK